MRRLLQVYRLVKTKQSLTWKHFDVKPLQISARNTWIIAWGDTKGGTCQSRFCKLSQTHISLRYGEPAYQSLFCKTFMFTSFIKCHVQLWRNSYIDCKKIIVVFLIEKTVTYTSNTFCLYTIKPYFVCKKIWSFNAMLGVTSFMNVERLITRWQMMKK